MNFCFILISRLYSYLQSVLNSQLVTVTAGGRALLWTPAAFSFSLQGRQFWIIWVTVTHVKWENLSLLVSVSHVLADALLVDIFTSLALCTILSPNKPNGPVLSDIIRLLKCLVFRLWTAGWICAVHQMYGYFSSSLIFNQNTSSLVSTNLKFLSVIIKNNPMLINWGILETFVCISQILYINLDPQPGHVRCLVSVGEA